MKKITEEKKDLYFIKLNGKANIPVPLSIGHNFHVISDCSITQEQKDDNEDGTMSITYKAEPITCEISQDNGQTIKAKDPRKNSQKIRNTLWKHYFNEGIVEPFDDVYDAATIEMIMFMPEILRRAVKRLNKN